MDMTSITIYPSHHHHNLWTQIGWQHFTKDHTHKTYKRMANGCASFSIEETAPFLGELCRPFWNLKKKTYRFCARQFPITSNRYAKLMFCLSVKCLSIKCAHIIHTNIYTYQLKRFSYLGQFFVLILNGAECGIENHSKWINFEFK